MKLFNFLLAALVCSPLLAQNPAKLPSFKLSPKHETELREHLAEQQHKLQPQSAMSQAERKMPQRAAQSDGTTFLRDSTVCFTGTKRDSKYAYTYDESGRVTSEVLYNYSTGIIWEGEQSCRGWEYPGIRFNDREGNLPSLNDETYERMVGKTMHVDIKEVGGEGTFIRVTNGWWSAAYVPETPVKAGDTFSFEFTQEMADDMKPSGNGKDLVFVSNNGLTITRFYFDDEFKEEPNSKKEYKYDAAGNTIGYAQYNWQDGDWVNIIKNETLFDENGRETEYYMMQSGRGMRYEYLFDADGKKIGYLSYALNDGEWTLQSKTEYTFDDNGYVTGGISYTPTDGEWVVTSKFEDAFDANGRLIANVEYILSDGEWTGSSKNEYAYDDHGNPTYAAWSTGTDGKWTIGAAHKYENTYDANGLLTDMIYSYYVFGGKWVIDSKSIYNYDANDNMICQIDYAWKNGEWVESHKYESTYDEDGNLTRYESFVYTYNGWNSSRTELHYYTGQHVNGIKQAEAGARNASRKFMKDGKILIMKGNNIYNVQGQQIEK